MCNPLLFGIALGGLQMKASSDAAKAQFEAQAAAVAENDRAAIEAKASADRQLNLNRQQEEEKHALESVNNALRGEALEARAKVVQSSSGLRSNNSAIVQDMRRQGLMAENMSVANMQRMQMQRQETSKGYESTYQSRINSMARPVWDSSDVFQSSFLAGASTGLSAYSAASSINTGGGTTPTA